MIVISDPFSLHIIFLKSVSSEFLSGEEKTKFFLLLVEFVPVDNAVIVLSCVSKWEFYKNE